jgi:hypothetical protein
MHNGEEVQLDPKEVNRFISLLNEFAEVNQVSMVEIGMLAFLISYNFGNASEAVPERVTKEFIEYSRRNKDKLLRLLDDVIQLGKMNNISVVNGAEALSFLFDSYAEDMNNFFEYKGLKERENG